jgi:acetyl-CoA acetyltransferase
MDEDDRARLTTNIVNCDPESVFIGQRVRVVFDELAEEIWLPLFEPDPDAVGDVGPLPEPRDYRAALRPMPTREKFEDKVALTGIGQSTLARRQMVDPLALTMDACLAAVADAGLTIDDIDGLSTYPGPMPADAGFSEGGIMAVCEAMQLTPTWVNGAMETPGQIGSIMAAMLAVAAGLCRHVLCFRTVWQATHSELVRSGRWAPAGGRPTGMAEWRTPYGAYSASSWIALNASHYFHRYGANREMLGALAVSTRRYATTNPEAIYRDPLTMDDYLAARMISTPFCLYDCDVPIDGSVAVVVSAVDTVSDLKSKPVFVEAVGTQVLERLSWDQDTFVHMPQALGPSAHLWTRTSLKPTDVDVAELYDGFSFNTISWIEGLGFCGFGEATDFLDGGAGIAIDGPLPLNTHGGQLSAGRTHGYGYVREAVRQLRGEAVNQVPHAKVAVCTAGGGVPSGAMLLRSE